MVIIADDNDEEMRHRLKELKKIYKVKKFVLFYFDLLNKIANYTKNLT